MLLSYVYLRTYGGLKNQQINFDPQWRFEFDGEKLKATSSAGLPSDFFSVGDAGCVPVDSVSAIIGENGTGKTSLARFLAEFFAGKGLRRDYIVVAHLSGEYYVFYNFSSTRKSLHIEGGPLIGENNCFNASSTDGDVKERMSCILTRVRLVYVSPQFAMTKMFDRNTKQVYDYSTFGLLTNTNRSWGLCNVRKYAAKEQLRALRVISAYAHEDGAPSEPGNILLHTGIRLTWPRSFVLNFGSFQITRTFQSDDSWRDVVELLRRFSQSSSFRKSSCLITKTFSFFVAACFLERFNRVEICFGDRFMRAFKVLKKVCNGLIESGDDFDRTKEIIFDWLAAPCTDRELEESRQGLKDLLKAIGELRCDFACQNRNSSLTVSLPCDQVVLTIADAYSRCVGAVDFLEFEFDPQLSSGEMSFLSMWGRLYDFVKSSENDMGGDDVIVYLDEAETSLHPAWQRKLVWYTIWFFEHFATNRRVHIIFASHSPILLSDIPRSNVHFLFGSYDKKNCMKEMSRLRDTFAANIFDLYRLSFFMNEGTVGKFACMKVNGLLRDVSHHKARFEGKYSVVREEDRQSIVRLIGDLVIRRYLLDSFGLEE